MKAVYSISIFNVCCRFTVAINITFYSSLLHPVKKYTLKLFILVTDLTGFDTGVAEM